MTSLAGGPLTTTPYMDDLGNILREARETKGLTIDEVQEQIRINGRYLRALESGEYNVLPTPVHVRGYLRNYARFLDLDPAPLLERYELRRSRLEETSNGRRHGNSEELIPAIDEQPFFNPVNMELDSSFGVPGDTESRLRLIIIAALIIAIALVANRFIPLITGNGDGTVAIQAAVRELINNASGEPEPTLDVTDNNLFMDQSGASSDLPVTSTGRGGLDSELAGPTPTRPALPATMERVQLRIEITERTWLRVTIDGEVVLEGMFTRDDGPFEWEALQQANVRTSNGIGTFVTINGIELGKLGGRQEVIDETWTTTAN